MVTVLYGAEHLKRISIFCWIEFWKKLLQRCFINFHTNFLALNCILSQLIFCKLTFQSLFFFGSFCSFYFSHFTLLFHIDQFGMIKKKKYGTLIKNYISTWAFFFQHNRNNRNIYTEVYEQTVKWRKKNIKF